MESLKEKKNSHSKKVSKERVNIFKICWYVSLSIISLIVIDGLSTSDLNFMQGEKTITSFVLTFVSLLSPVYFFVRIKNILKL